MTNVCSKCQTPAAPGATFCDNCGNRLAGGQPVAAGGGPPAGTRCPSCNAPVTPGQAFCDSCGSALSAVSPIAPTVVQPYNQPPPPAYNQPTPSAYNQPTPVYNPPLSTYNQPAPAMGGGAMSCPNCHLPVTPGAAFCDSCGAALAMPVPAGPVSPNAPTIFDLAPQPPQPSYPSPQPPPPSYPSPQPPQPSYPSPQPPQPNYPSPQPPQPSYPSPQPPPSYPSAITPRLVVNATNAPLTLPAGKSELLIGREDAVSNHFPDVDLGPHGGEEGGVGRRHAKLYIRGGQCFIEDLQSVNYTFVNRQKLNPGNQQPLNNGDELRFGRVVLRFYTS